MLDIAPPPYNTQSTGTLLILDSDDFTENRFWRSDADRERPTFTIRSLNHGKRRILYSRLDEAVVGEVVFYGAAKLGYGTVSIAGAKPMAIEDWMRGGRDVKIHGDLYQWSHFTIKRGVTMQTIFEARLNNQPIAMYSGPRQRGPGGVSEMARPHMTIADSVDFNQVVGELILSLLILQHLEHKENISSFGDSLARKIAAVLTI